MRNIATLHWVWAQLKFQLPDSLNPCIEVLHLGFLSKNRKQPHEETKFLYNGYRREHTLINKVLSKFLLIILPEIVYWLKHITKSTTKRWWLYPFSLIRKMIFSAKRFLWKKKQKNYIHKSKWHQRSKGF